MTKRKPNKELEAYFRHAKNTLFPKVKSAAVSITILNSTPDPKLCMELGANILFDKPIILWVPDREMWIPENLRRVATAIVFGSTSDPDTQQRIQAALTEAMKDKRAQ